MPLSTLTLNDVVSWALYKTNTGFNNTTQSGSVNFTLNNVDVSVINQLVSNRYTIATSGSQAIDLTSLTNLVGETVNFTHVLLLMVSGTGATFTVGPSASNGFTYFWSGTTPANALPDGGCLLLTGPGTGTGGTVDGTHKSITVTNTGAGSLTANVTIVGTA